MANEAFTYDDNLVREDLLNLITNLTPRENQLFSGLSSSAMAQSYRHEWGKDTLDTVAVNAAVEGADATNRSLTNPSRLINYTQILEKTYAVTGTEQAVDQAGFSNRMNYEASKAFRSLINDAEFALMRGTLACGSTSVARTLRGVKSWMSSNNYTNPSGVSLSENMLNDYFQEVWDDGAQVDAVYAPMTLKRRISGFTAGATKNVDIVDRRLVNAVDIYQADAAQNVRLFAHRYITIAADTNNDIIGLQEDKWALAFLRRPFTTPLAKVGDADREQVLMELTLECMHEDAGFHTEGVL